MHQQQVVARWFFLKTAIPMKQLDEIIYDAIRSDASLMEAIGDRVVSTCFEVPPTEDDNTPLPNVIITDDGFQNNTTTKDCVWEGGEDQVQVTVDIAAKSPEDVKQLVRRVRRVVEQHISRLYNQGEEIPILANLTSNGIAWDWMKPCYFTNLVYQCITKADI